jgi:hypothetical protein
MTKNGISLTIVAVFLVGLLYGWISNIWLLLNINDYSIEFAIRIAGLFIVPLGAVMGYF